MTPGRVQSLDRALDLLEALTGAGRPVTLSDLATQADLAPATAHRLMATLLQRGYARQTADRSYEPGPALISIADGALRILASTTMPHLKRLVDLTGETANLAVLDGDSVLYVAQSPSPHAMRMFTQVGSRVLPHCTGVGKALLADRPEADVRALLLRTGMPSQTASTITDPDEFLRVLARVRRDGHALDDGEREVGVTCVAVPVAGSLPSALSISGPRQRLTAQVIRGVVPALQGIASALAAELGRPVREPEHLVGRTP